MLTYEINQTQQFSTWLNSVRNQRDKFRLLIRLDRASRGNLGNIKSLGAGLFEMREFFGPGWRMYFFEPHKGQLIMLVGGTKASQARDIFRAKHTMQEFKR